jgi:hypothetical protein
MVELRYALEKSILFRELIAHTYKTNELALQEKMCVE